MSVFLFLTCMRDHVHAFVPLTLYEGRNTGFCPSPLPSPKAPSSFCLSPLTPFLWHSTSRQSLLSQSRTPAPSSPPILSTYVVLQDKVFSSTVDFPPLVLHIRTKSPKSIKDLFVLSLCCVIHQDKISSSKNDPPPLHIPPVSEIE